MYPNCQLQKWGNNFIGGVALSESKKDIITNHVITLCLIWRSLHAFHNHKETKVPKLYGSLIACDVLTRALRQENSCTCSSEREKHADTDIQCRRVCACVCVCVCVCVSFSHVWLFATPWTVAHQAPLSMGFSRWEHWRYCHSLLQGMFLTQVSNLGILH